MDAGLANPDQHDPYDAPPEEEILEGQSASAEDVFWARKLWELEAEGPALLTEASQQLMSLAALLSGIYLATLGLLGIEGSVSQGLRALSLTPYLAWLPAFVCAYRAYHPQRSIVADGDAAGFRTMLQDLAAGKRRWCQAAQWLVFGGLVLAVFWVGYLLIHGLTPPQAPDLAGTGS